MAANPKSIFRSLTQQQCKDCFELIRQNAGRHFSTAQLLASQSDFANGVAHLILGTEELIKSAMLMLQGFGFPVKNIRNYDKLFYNHSARHKVLKECYSVYLFVSNIVEKRPSKLTGQTRAQYLSHLILHGLRAAKEGLENYEWWTNADKLKQKCFYVDYTEEGLANPQNINQKDWEVAYRFVSTFTLDLNKIMIEIGNASPKKLQQYIADFENADLVNLFSGSINR